MTLNKNIKYDGKEYKCTGKSGCGAGEMYVFREIIGANGTEKLSDSCMIFQVYRNNGSIEITAYNGGNPLVGSLEQLIKEGF